MLRRVRALVAILAAATSCKARHVLRVTAAPSSTSGLIEAKRASMAAATVVSLLDGSQPKDATRMACMHLHLICFAAVILTIDLHGIFVRAFLQYRIDSGQNRVTNVDIGPCQCNTGECAYRMLSICCILSFGFSDRNLSYSFVSERAVNMPKRLVLSQLTFTIESRTVFCSV